MSVPMNMKHRLVLALKLGGRCPMRTWGRATPPLLLSGLSPGRAFLPSVGPVLCDEPSGLCCPSCWRRDLVVLMIPDYIWPCPSLLRPRKIWLRQLC